MLALLFFVLAVACWFAGFINYTYGNPPKAPNWIAGGLFFAGLGLWIAPLVR